MTIWFDMDGTIADLYAVDGWLDMLIDGNTTPYEVAKPMVNMSVLARYLNRLQKQGYHIGIISWLSKSGTDEYNMQVAEVKRKWLKKHLRSVNFNEINIINYGRCKDNFRKSVQDILFDDEERNRNEWCGQAFDVNNILEVLRSI